MTNTTSAAPTTRKWIACADRLPPEGETVDTKIEDVQGLRNEQQLKRRGRLWFFADDSMYVYYTPTHWRSTGGSIP